MSRVQDAKNNGRERVIAVVSGKGGSGKTMIVAIMADILSTLHTPVTVVDADTGTAGLTYYLGLDLVRNIRVGLSNIATMLIKGLPFSSDFLYEYLQPIKGLEVANFLGIGDHRRLEKEVSETDLPSILKLLIESLRGLGSWILVDCRGGIDRESIAVCGVADDIILISESDTTSFQATKHIVDVLSDNDLAHKLRGFIINKVFDNPSTLVSQGTTIYGTQFLSAIPFDFQATRSFLKGEIPRKTSLFGIHVWAALEKAYPIEILSPPGRVWSFEDYREVGLTNIDSTRGGAIVSAILLSLGIAYYFKYVVPGGLSLWTFIRSGLGQLWLSILFFGLLGSLESTRRSVGKVFNFYLRLFNLKRRG
jgi:flagellar biosynthesis protein FlhG